ncbi:MAG: hypothetical protein ABIV13_02425 [Fimbriimonadales bacterium]
MKLNLLPKTAARSAQSRTALMAMAVLVVLTLAGTMLYASQVSKTLAGYKEEVAAKEIIAKQIVDTAASADTILANSKIVLTNFELVKQIDNSNGKYPRLYNTLKGYIPSFIRVRSISAASGGPENSVVTIQGYLKTFQQYSDVMIALLRFPGCSAVGRSGFGPIASGDAGPFGYDPANPERGPIPGWSSVTLTMSITSGPFANLQAPEPRATLAGAGTGAAPPAGGQPAAGQPPISATTGGAPPSSGGGNTLLGGLKGR